MRGTSRVTLPPTGLYQDLSRGMADGAAIAWTAVATWRRDEVMKDHLEAPLGQAPVFVFMNEAAYAALSREIEAHDRREFGRVLFGEDRRGQSECR